MVFAFFCARVHKDGAGRFVAKDGTKDSRINHLRPNRSNDNHPLDKVDNGTHRRCRGHAVLSLCPAVAVDYHEDVVAS